MPKRISNSRLEKVLGGMLDAVNNEPLLLRKGVLNGTACKNICFLYTTPCPDDFSYASVCVSKGKAHFYFYGLDFPKGILTESTSEARNMIKVMMDGKYVDYVPHAEFARSLIEHFNENFSEYISTEMAKERLKKVKEVLIN